MAFGRWFKEQGDRATPADLKSKIDDRRIEDRQSSN